MSVFASSPVDDTLLKLSTHTHSSSYSTAGAVGETYHLISTSCSLFVTPVDATDEPLAPVYVIKNSFIGVTTVFLRLKYL
ncbi:hypothetical protein D3C87_493320 [compost metagenome]